MKKSIVVVLFSFINCIGISQSKVESWGDSWIENNRGLEVGDIMPDMEMGNILNNSDGITKYSDLKGKVVVLDFWTTTCASCIAFFPKMEKLQEKYKEQIKVFIVNVAEDEELIKLRLGQRYTKKIVLPNLPSIVGAKELGKLFPLRYVPHHVIIDQHGIIRIVGPSYNTYEKKIEDIVNGKKIQYLNGENTRPEFNDQISLHTVLGKKVIPGQINSVLSPFNNDYAPISGGEIINLFDSSSATIRNTWVNIPIWEVYVKCFPEIQRKYRHEVIFSKYGSYRFFDGIDTSMITDEFISRNSKDFRLTDTSFMNTRICYEQIAPYNLREPALSELRLKELNNYFNSKLRINVVIKKKEVKCWVLKKRSNYVSIVSKLKDGVECKEFEFQGKKFVKYNNILLREALKSSMTEMLLSDDSGIHFIDESGLSAKKVKLELPVKFKNLEEVNMYLSKYGLKIFPEKKKIDLIVFHRI